MSIDDIDAELPGDGARAVDLVVVGDGPAGSALANAAAALRVGTVLVGPDDPWTATYATWIDDLAGVPRAKQFVGRVVTEIDAHADRSVTLHRLYGILDNGRLRDILRENVEHVTDRVTDVVPNAAGGRHVVQLAGGARFDARVVVDTSGWPATFARRLTNGPAPAWQTAMGVVLPEPPSGDLGRPTWMDFRPVDRTVGTRSAAGSRGVTTFCYSLPVEDGWLVEETVLAARPAVEPIALLPRLAARLGRHPDDLLAEAVRVEYVQIPMGGRRPHPDQPVVAFGAAAGYVHPATGFSIATSLRAAPRVAAAIADAIASTPEGDPVPSDPIAEAVWPMSLRRTRVLHDYGLEMMLKLDEDDVREFFGSFFALDEAEWPAYLRLDSSPNEVSRVMASLFKSVSWPMRRRLMSANPTMFARLVRP